MYRITFNHAARKAFLSLPPNVRARLRPHIDALSSNPYPPGCKAMVGQQNMYRIRVSDYRIVYEVYNGELLIVIVRISHRRDVYRRL